jgi:hypothetical protein
MGKARSSVHTPQQHVQQQHEIEQQHPSTAVAAASTTAAGSDSVEANSVVTDSSVTDTVERSPSDAAHVQVKEVPLEDRRASVISHIRELAHAQRYTNQGYSANTVHSSCTLSSKLSA